MQTVTFFGKGTVNYVGKQLTLVPEPDNSKDPDAIAAYIGDTLCGYLGNRKSTVFPGSLRASEVLSYFDKYDCKILVGPAANIGTTPANHSELFLIPKNRNKEDQDEEIVLLIGGATARNPNKSAVATAIISHEEVALFLELVGDTIIVRQPGVDAKAGTVMAKNDKALVEKVKQFLKNSQQTLPVQATGDVEKSSSGLDYYVKLKLEGEEAYKETIVTLAEHCLLSAPEAEEKIRFMQRSGLPDKLIQAVLERNGKIRYGYFDRMSIPVPPVPYHQSSGTILWRTLSYALTGRNIRVYGPKGGGKNTLLETVLWLLGVPMYRMSISGDLDKFDLMGGPQLIDGNSSVVPSDMLKCLERGYCVVFDEANSARAEVLESIHSITDSKRAVQVPGYGEVKLHQMALVAMTMNEGYVGCGEMNEATIDRFVPIEVNPEPNIEDLLRSMVPAASDDDISVCVKVNALLINGIKQSKFSENCISIRGFNDALIASTAGFLTIGQALLDNLGSKSQDVDERKSIQSMIKDVTGDVF